jgi:hypothetical protein
LTITIDLQPEVEGGLLARAEARGLSINDYLQDIVARDVGVVVESPAFFDAGEIRAAQAANLVELFEPMRGMLTDEEIDTLFSRNPSTGRTLEV